MVLPFLEYHQGQFHTANCQGDTFHGSQAGTQKVTMHQLKAACAAQLCRVHNEECGYGQKSPNLGAGRQVVPTYRRLIYISTFPLTCRRRGKLF